MTDDLDEVDEHELVLGPRPMSKNELDEFEAAESCRTLVLRSSGSRRASVALFPAAIAGFGLVGAIPTAATFAPDEVVGLAEGTAEEGSDYRGVHGDFTMQPGQTELPIEMEISR